MIGTLLAFTYINLVKLSARTEGKCILEGKARTETNS